MITLYEFVSKYLGKSKGYPTDNEFLGECLSIVKLYIKEVFGINPPPSGSGSAYGYWTNFPSPLGDKFEKVEDTDTMVPEEGWIAIWKPWSTNKYGHISIVSKGSTVNTLKNWAQNWTSKTFQLESNKYDNVVGYLKPKIINSEPDMTQEESNILKFLKEQGANEGRVREAFGALNDAPDKDKQIQTLQARVLDLEKSQKDLEDRLTALESNIQADLKLITDWQQASQTANKKVEQLSKELKLQSDEKNTWKNRYEQALKDQVNKYTGWELVKIGVTKLMNK